MEEVWRDVINFVGIYQVSNYGNIRGKNGIRKSVINPRNGYLGILLFKNGKRYYRYIHRLVAEAFIPNPDNLNEINHKDFNIINNFVCLLPGGNIDEQKTNLEWCTHHYNTKNRRPYCKTFQYDLNGRLLNVFNSVKEAAKTIFNDDSKSITSAISSVCNNHIKSYRGYMFKH